MTHPTSLEHLANDKIRTARAEGLRSQQLKRRANRSPVVRRVMWAGAGLAALLTTISLLF